MHLTPSESDKLSIVTAGFLAQRRLARGCRLSYPEAVALLSLVLLELIRDGRHSVSQLMELGSTILGRREVMDGVAEMLETLHIEGTFPDGTKLVAVNLPLRNEKGHLSLALYGSFLPVPDEQLFESVSQEMALNAQAKTQQYLYAQSPIELNEGRPVFELEMTNTDGRPIQVGSHFHLAEANPRLVFDRELAVGKRLDIPAGTAIRFEAGESRKVGIVPIAGHQMIKGGNRFANGRVGQGADLTESQPVVETAK
ncbi:urease subunit gamma [Entomobacter blattae]|uniref:urease subunit gamma n=1 Tax=Entomobacter blattae TaxID=2762277 RepID=UPI00193C22C0|nr:urease subunit gamma [Entomobacter blattae]